MSWGALARAAFVAVIAYSAVELRPLGSGAPLNIAFGAGIAGLIIFLEDRLARLRFPMSSEPSSAARLVSCSRV